MKKLIAFTMAAAALYQVAKKNGVNTFQDLKQLFLSEFKSLGREVKHELLA